MKNIIYILLIFPAFLFGQSEVVINKFLSNDQRDPKITGSNNSKVVVYTSYNQASGNSKEDIYLQYVDENFNASGNEILVNDITEGEQVRPTTAMNSNGDFIIAWTSFTNNESGYDIKAKLFRSGNPSSEFLVNTGIANSQTKPSAAIHSDGSFIIVWESWFEDGSDRGVFAQRFLPDGTKNGEQFRVNITTTYSQCKPVVKFFPDGKFVVVWESWMQDVPGVPGYGIYARIFGAAGEPSSNEIKINNYTADYQWYADVEVLDNENYVIAWCSWEQDGSDGGIYIKKLNAYWEYGTEVLVNSTTQFYQWLPELSVTPAGNIAVIWSSWEQDGSREGIYARLLDSLLNEKSFEIRLNDVTNNFQWEPSVYAVDDDEIMAVWSGFNENEKGYNIIGKKTKLMYREAVIGESGYSHTSGVSTTGFLVNVIDSVQLTGDTYEISFTKNSAEVFSASIKNLNTNNVVVPSLALGSGENYYYLSPVFDGVAVQMKPVFSLDVDVSKSFFRNNSGTNIQFSFTNPTGTTVIAPLDLFVEWGNTDRNPDGTYVNPLDSAYGVSGKMEVKVPFRVWDITGNKRMNAYIIEPVVSRNKRWEPGEAIVILTPPEYQKSFPNFHIQISNSTSAGDILYPQPGDTIFIFTKRPVTTEDVYKFTTSKNYIVGLSSDNNSIPLEYSLKQNYPNPFNPITTIAYTLPDDSNVKLKVYNTIGELISVLVNGFVPRGNHRVIFDAHKYSSGIYFYTLESENKFITRKMILLK